MKKKSFPLRISGMHCLNSQKYSDLNKKKNKISFSRQENTSFTEPCKRVQLSKKQRKRIGSPSVGVSHSVPRQTSTGSHARWCVAPSSGSPPLHIPSSPHSHPPPPPSLPSQAQETHSCWQSPDRHLLLLATRNRCGKQYIQAWHCSDSQRRKFNTKRLFLSTWQAAKLFPKLRNEFIFYL